VEPTADAVFSERVNWIFADLAAQLARAGAALSIQGRTARVDGAPIALDGSSRASEGLLLAEIDGEVRAFRWSDQVSVWFDASDGTTLFDALAPALPDGVALEPARVLSIEDLRTYFHTEDAIVKAVDGLDVAIAPGQTLGLVGESGSGKSVTSLTLMGLLPEFSARIPSGRAVFLGRDLLSLRKADLAAVRGDDVAMIFQEPMTSLNPVLRVGDQVAEAIVLHRRVSNAEARKRTIDLFREVGIPDPEQRVDSYPHEMSGGQKQRVMIAMALSCDPRLLIADEPTTALDVTIQRQILDLLRHLRDSRGMSMLFITHDLGVIAEIADRVAVMYRGRLVEYGDVLEVFSAPQHPYTRGLLACRPRLDTRYQLLPTVADFLETSVEGGEVVVRERPPDPELETRLRTGARAKLTEVEGDPVLSVRDLAVWFPKGRDLLGRVKGWIKAVDGVSFDVYRGQTLGLVGESGCGKTTTGRAILRLVPPRAGTVTFLGQDLSALDAGTGARRRALYAGGVIGVLLGFLALVTMVITEVESLGLLGWSVVFGPILAGLASTGAAMALSEPIEKRLRRQVQIIFQDPYSSLNPRQSVGDALVEAMTVHGLGDSREDRVRRAGDLLEEVGLERGYLRRYPHEFSGGQRQRICIARTLALEPTLIICDESVSALDVSVQAQVLNLLRELQIRRGLTYIFISHDLSVVKFMSDVMCVMKDGRIVEAGPSDAIYADPREDYTKALISAIPSDDIDHIRALQRGRAEAAAARLRRALIDSAA
jgi:peptide/nickel transport system ATP-binding protein